MEHQIMTIQKDKLGIQIITKQKFLKNYNPANLINSGGVKSFEEIFEKKSHSISKIRKEWGESFTVSYIKVWLVELNELLNLRRPMTESQISFAARLVVDEFYNLNINDLQFLFIKILKGEQGELYESLNPPKILTFFREYLNERMTQGAQKSLSKHLDSKNI